MFFLGGTHQPDSNTPRREPANSGGEQYALIHYS